MRLQSNRADIVLPCLVTTTMQLYLIAVLQVKRQIKDVYFPPLGKTVECWYFEYNVNQALYLQFSRRHRCARM